MDDEIEFDMDSAIADVSTGLGFEPPAADDTPADGDPAPAADDTTGKLAGDESLAGKPSPGGVTGVAAKPVDGAQPPAAPAPDATTLKAPASWRPEAKAEFDKLPPVIKAEVVKREEDILRGIGEYKAAANFGTAMDKAIQPYAPALRQYGIDPVRHVGELFDIHQRLALGTPEVKQATLQALAKNFGITLAPAQDDADSPYVDPQVKDLQRQMAELQSLQQRLVDQQTLQSRAATETQREQVMQTLRTELNTFAADPEHAFFDEVATDMAMLIQSGRASSLKQAYELAVRLSPEVASKEALRKQSATEAAKLKDKQAAAAKTTAARRATGVNVTGQPAVPGRKPPSPGKGLQNLDASIEAAFDSLMAKD